MNDGAPARTGAPSPSPSPAARYHQEQSRAASRDLNFMNDANQRTTPTGPLPFQEVVEAQGHLIDSQILEVVFDEVVQFGGRFEVEEFRIGRTNEEPSYLRLRVETPTESAMERLLQNLNSVGWTRHCGRWKRIAAHRRIFTPPLTTRPWCESPGAG